MNNHKKRAWILGCILLLLLGMLATVAVSAQDEDSETPVTMDELPEAVAAVFTKFAAAGEVGNLYREHESGAVVYTADISIGGGSFELELDDAGNIVEVEAGDDDDEGDDEDDDDNEDEDGN